MEQPRTEQGQPVPRQEYESTPPEHEQQAGREYDEAQPQQNGGNANQHWSPFAPAAPAYQPLPPPEGAPPEYQTPPQGGLNPSTQQQATVGPANPYQGQQVYRPGANDEQPAPPPAPPADPQQFVQPPHEMPSAAQPGYTNYQGVYDPHTGQQQAPQPEEAPPPPPQQQQQMAAPANEAPQNQNLPMPQQNDGMEANAVTAEDFARRRTAVPTKPVATMGARAKIRKSTFGLLKLSPSKWERDVLRSTEAVRRNFGGLRQITVVNPKGGAGKTVCVLMLAMMFGQRRGGYVLAWDNNETQGTLGMRAQQDFHNRTVRDLLLDMDHFRGPTGRVGDLSQYVRSQGEAMFDVLASDESATAGEMLTSQAFGNIREIVNRFYKLIVVDTGNNVRAQNWQSSIDATDQLVVPMSARNDSAETAARMLDHLEQSGRRELVRRAVTVVSMPAHRKDLDLPAVQRHFSARTRGVLLAPYEKLLDSGEPIRYGVLSQATREAWLKIAASVAEGL